MRLIRDVTPSGNVRVLMANLLDAARYPAAKFGALYHRRWRVEEAFKRIKHRLRLEGPSGLTYLAFQQDFAAKVLADKHCQLLSAEPAPPDTPSRPNRTYAQGALKRILAGCLLALEHVRIPLQTALDAIQRTRCRPPPGRSYPRPARVKSHHHLACKGE